MKRTKGQKDKTLNINSSVYNTSRSREAAAGGDSNFFVKLYSKYVKPHLFPFLGSLLSGLFIAFMLEQGRSWLGWIGGLSLFTLFMAAWRLWRGREVFLNVVEMGADQLDVALRQRKKRKEEEVEDEEVVNDG